MQGNWPELTADSPTRVNATLLQAVSSREREEAAAKIGMPFLSSYLDLLSRLCLECGQAVHTGYGSHAGILVGKHTVARQFELMPLSRLLLCRLWQGRTSAATG